MVPGKGICFDCLSRPTNNKRFEEGRFTNSNLVDLQQGSNVSISESVHSPLSTTFVNFPAIWYFAVLPDYWRIWLIHLCYLTRRVTVFAFKCSHICVSDYVCMGELYRRSIPVCIPLTLYIVSQTHSIKKATYITFGQFSVHPVIWTGAW